jgi:hypothetical protein
MAVAGLSTGLVLLHAHWSPGLWRGAAGGLAYALAEFLADCRDEFPSGRSGWLYLAQVVGRVILGAIVGAATLALGQSAAFIAGLAGPQALIALGAKFGRRRRRRPGGNKPRRRGREAGGNADNRPPSEPEP